MNSGIRPIMRKPGPPAALPLSRAPHGPGLDSMQDAMAATLAAPKIAGDPHSAVGCGFRAAADCWTSSLIGVLPRNLREEP